MDYEKWYDKHISGKTASEYSSIVGVKAKEGIVIARVLEHTIDRAIERNVSARDVKDALQNPLKIGKIKIDEKGRPSQKYIGEKATCSINPDTGAIIQVNPTSSKYAKRLKDRGDDGAKD